MKVNKEVVRDQLVEEQNFCFNKCFICIILYSFYCWIEFFINPFTVHIAVKRPHAF